MEKYVTGSCAEYHQNDVDCIAMLEISQHYKKHNVWTWMDDYDWFPQECYIRGPLSPADFADGRWLYPLNYIRLSSLQTINQPVGRSLLARLRRKLSRTLKQIREVK